MNLNIQDLAAIIGPLGFLMYLLWKKVDKCATKEDLSKVEAKVDKCAKGQDLSNLTGKVMDLNRDIGIVQGQLIPKVIPFQEEKPKKKAKGE